MKITYKYENIKDKSKEGMDKELSEGLVKGAFFFYQTYGFPLDVFKDELKNFDNKAKQWSWYMNFRNEHPDVFK